MNDIWEQSIENLVKKTTFVRIQKNIKKHSELTIKKLLFSTPSTFHTTILKPHLTRALFNQLQSVSVTEFAKDFFIEIEVLFLTKQILNINNKNITVLNFKTLDYQQNIIATFFFPYYLQFRRDETYFISFNSKLLTSMTESGLKLLSPQIKPISSVGVSPIFTGLFKSNKDNIKLYTEIYNQLPDSNFKNILSEIYFPKTLKSALYAKTVIDVFHMSSAKAAMMKEEQNNLIESDEITLYDYQEILEEKIKKYFNIVLSPEQLLAIIGIVNSALKGRGSLLHGEVGSGKTIVVIGAIFLLLKLNVEKIGVMSPTKLLFKQTFDLMNKIFALEIEAKRLIIGTHSVAFQNNDLDILFVDEEQKFGVDFKEAISKVTVKITATPLPRTQAEITFGKIDKYEIFSFREKVIRNLVLSTDNICDTIVSIIQKYSGKTLIIASRISTLKQIVADISNVISKKILVMHGEILVKEQALRMEEFKRDPESLCISTAILEIGIDLPDIKNIIFADFRNFGLSQLHQFRGRIARKIPEGNCFLLVDKNIDDEKMLFRAKLFSKCSTGKQLALIDKNIRGVGELTGKKQSGKNSSFDFVLYNNFKDFINLYYNKSK